MLPDLTRRSFVAAASGSCLAVPLGLVRGAFAGEQSGERGAAEAGSTLPPGFPSHEPALAREIVTKSHFDLESVTKLVEARPTLAKAAWDWGFGDTETALGAASHVGRRDIAEVLMAHGARADIFTLAMFGHLEAIKAIIAANPGIQQTTGPHGITLLAHAKAGKEQAAAVVEYLQSRGDADPAAIDLPLDAATRSAMIGTYAYELANTQGASKPTCSIIEQRGSLAFKHEPDGTPRNLFHQGDGQFHPAGAPKVRITIQGHDLTITNGEITLAARRMK